MNLLREPDAGNPHVRFDEGRANRTSVSFALLLYGAFACTYLR